MSPVALKSLAVDKASAKLAVPWNAPLNVVANMLRNLSVELPISYWLLDSGKITESPDVVSLNLALPLPSPEYILTPFCILIVRYPSFKSTISPSSPNSIPPPDTLLTVTWSDPPSVSKPELGLYFNDSSV